jgi:oligoendopeptidase F
MAWFRAAVSSSLCLVMGAASALAGELPAHVPDANLARSAVPDVFKWDLSPLFASDAAWEQARTQLLTEIPGLARYQGRLGDPESLAAGLAEYFRLHRQADFVALYANLRNSTSLSDPATTAMFQQGLSAMEELMRAAAFIRGEVLPLPTETLEAAYTSRPALAECRSYLDNLRRRKSRVLSPDAERALALLGDNLWAEIELSEMPSPVEDVFSALLGDIPWPSITNEQGKLVPLTLANYGRFRESPSREVRRAAVAGLFGSLRQYQHAMAAALGGQLELDVAYARARSYPTALEAYLDKEGIDTAVFDNLVATVNARLPLLHRYIDLRKRVLGLPEIHLYDLYVPLVADVETHIPFVQARASIMEALEPLGPEYRQVLAEGLDPRNGWLDLYPHHDKRSGAFSLATHGPHPYVFMNYQDSLDDMSTLAHEYGHALHSHLAMKARPYADFRYTTFLAEVASTCNEALLSDHLVAKTEDPAEKAYLLVGLLETIRTTIFRQTMFAEFERQAHELVEAGTPVTAPRLEAIYRAVLEKYYGPGYTIDPDDGMEWAYIPHFYYKYYVYSYATGLSAGIAMADRIRELGPPAAHAYLEMLGSGAAGPSLGLLQKAGVDLTRPDAIEASMSRFERTLDEVEGLLGR